jgi:hypothetical protein
VCPPRPRHRQGDQGSGHGARWRRWQFTPAGMVPSSTGGPGVSPGAADRRTVAPRSDPHDIGVPCRRPYSRGTDRHLTKEPSRPSICHLEDHHAKSSRSAIPPSLCGPPPDQAVAPCRPSALERHSSSAPPSGAGGSCGRLRACIRTQTPKRHASVRGPVLTAITGQSTRHLPQRIQLTSRGHSAFHIVSWSVKGRRRRFPLFEPLAHPERTSPCTDPESTPPSS